MEFEAHEQQPQTQKFFLWVAVICFFTASIYVFSSYRDESERVEALRMTERQKEKDFASLEAERIRTSMFLERYTRDQEFVNDQARERLGVAAPGELVIRLDGTAAAVAPSKSVAKPANR
jgi:cell division protein FtsB